MIDSHLHLDDEKLSCQVDEVLQSAQNAGVTLFINNSCNYNTMLSAFSSSLKVDKRFTLILPISKALIISCVA